MGILIDGSLSVCIEDQMPYGGFYYFEKCYGIENDQTIFFDGGDSGAGFFPIGKEKKLKPLGIACVTKFRTLDPDLKLKLFNTRSHSVISEDNFLCSLTKIYFYCQKTHNVLL